VTLEPDAHTPNHGRTIHAHLPVATTTAPITIITPADEPAPSTTIPAPPQSQPIIIKPKERQGTITPRNVPERKVGVGVVPLPGSWRRERERAGEGLRKGMVSGRAAEVVRREAIEEGVVHILGNTEIDGAEQVTTPLLSLPLSCYYLDPLPPFPPSAAVASYQRPSHPLPCALCCLLSAALLYHHQHHYRH
jgi:hypothetical protein